MAVLLLNVDYSPLEVISWRTAVIKLLERKVELVEDYAGRMIRSPSLVLPSPAVVRHLGRYLHRRPAFSRRNILARDGYTCQYCGLQPRKRSGAPRLEGLTIDHVIPRVQSTGGRVRLANGEWAPVTSWQNVVAACEACNNRKGGRTPKQAGLKLARAPRPPTVSDLVWMDAHGVRIPDEWSLYLPEDSPWRAYWDVELAED